MAVMAEAIQISSPRAPRSSHHRSTSTRTTPPRQRDRVRSIRGQRPDQPNFGGSPRSPLVPENLNDDRDTFNVDPTSGTLEAGGETYQPPIAPAGRNIMGGFVGGLRKAWQQRNRVPPEPDVAFPEPAVVHEEETQYEPIPRGEPEIQYASPAPYTPYDPPLSYGGRSEAAHSPAPVEYTPVAADAEYPQSLESDPHRRQESSSSVSETVHATTQEHYEGTTAINHDMVLSDQIGSPEFVEPQPASDYAKMDSPPRSEASFGSYFTRVHRFLQTINDLPWIASDRVTVDYVPGKVRKPQGPTLRARPARKPAISWYNSNIPQGSVDLLSSGTPTSHLADFPEAKAMGTPSAYRATPSARYADVVYANNLPDSTRSAGPPPMASATPAMASQSMPQRPRRVPVPQVTDDLAAAAENDPFYVPRYPNGYVPYDQLSVVPTYTGSSAASAQSPPQHRQQMTATLNL
ncbi:hypothetical protein K438DRAFT_1819772 [Mycena galopus ATCC 62051]|nr:hypothetical protein K438DRAFT_1819772 [Mycena galopus ATCC 62051]